MPRVPFAEKCSQVYNYLVKSLSEGLPPTVREICRDCAIKSTSTVHKILDTLEENGYITRDAHSSRAIRVNKMSASAHIPVLGRVTAGQPILAVEDIEDYIPYPTKDADGLFALRVVGFSMKNVGILDGDIVVALNGLHGGLPVKSQQNCCSGKEQAGDKYSDGSDTHGSVVPHTSDTFFKKVTDTSHIYTCRRIFRSFGFSFP